MNIKKNVMVAVGFKWSGRILAMLLFLFWGAFFLEHLTKWFLCPIESLPPLSVWVSQTLHLVMLIGLAMMLKWEKLGALVMVIGTTAFFSTIGYRGFPFIALINLLPIGFFSGCWLISYSCRDERSKQDNKR